MRKICALITSIHLLALIASPAPAVELLTNGDFEDPLVLMSDWEFNAFWTDGGGDPVDPVSRATFGPQAGTNDAWLRPFVGGGRLIETNANVNLDGLPAGSVDGKDFAIIQRGIGIMGGATPADGDATNDGNVDEADVARWENNYGRQAGRLSNGEILQTIPATPGETYTFSGWARWELGFSGGFVPPNYATLDASGPLGEVPSPTTSTMEIQFLDASDNPIGDPVVYDLVADGGQESFNDWTQHTLPATEAPPGTAKIQVKAAAYDMVYNQLGGAGPQSGFFDSMSLTAASDPSTELLDDAGFDNQPSVPGWEITELPEGTNSAAVQNSNWADHTLESGGSGFWLRAFAGGETGADAIVSQTVPGVPDGNYSFSAWVRWEGNYSGGVDTLASGAPSTTETLLQMEFLDSGENVLETHTLDLRTVVTNGEDWSQQGINNVTSPANTAFVRVSGIATDMFFHQDPQQSAFFDDFSLDGPAASSGGAGVVPEPATTSLLLASAAALALRRRIRWG